MTQILRVYPNPWLATDRDGLPCAIVPTDPEGDGGGPGQYVGARVDRKRTKVLQDFGENAKHELRSPMQRTVYEYMGTASNDPELARKLFACEPIEIPRTKYYRQRLREGALLAADAETAASAKARFVPRKDLVQRYSLLVGLTAKADGTETTVTLEASPVLSAQPQLPPIEPGTESTERLQPATKGKAPKTMER